MGGERPGHLTPQAGQGGSPPPPRAGAAATVAAVILSGSLLLLFLIPLLALVSYATPQQIVAAASNKAVDLSLEFTLYASGIAVLISLGLGAPLGYLLARRSFPGHTVIESVVALPVTLPHLMVGLGFLLLSLPGSPVGNFAASLGLPLAGSIAGVVLVMVFVSAPYTVLASMLSFRAVDGRVIEAARSLGAGRTTAFLDVTWPLAARGIAAGLLLSWGRAVSEIGGILVVAYAVYPSLFYNGPVTSTISIYIYNLWSEGNLRGAAAVSSLFLLLAFALFVAVRLLERAGRLPWKRGELLP